MAKFYLTTTIPYVNADPHIGFALEIIQADAIARYHRLLGDDVFFNCGADEHGQKIYESALKEGLTPQEFCDKYAARFDALKGALNLSYTNFIRTTDEHHIMAAQEFWRRCAANGDIYKKNYEIKYCVGCELEKSDSELVDGKCPLHPNKELEIREEENYFFRFSKYQDALLKLYKDDPRFVFPENKLRDFMRFMDAGLQDFSISRIKEKMPWGIPVPDDENQIMYVWFDALVNYISAIGWPDDEEKFKTWWPVTQFAGKDQVRQQAAMWQAMLMSAHLPQSRQIFFHGFLNVGGQKISKSLGNVINPIDVAKQYGADALRYYLLAKVNPWEDSDYTNEKLVDHYNGDLANGLGNLVSRVAKLAEKVELPGLSLPGEVIPELQEKLDGFIFNEALQILWGKVSDVDKQINQDTPWKLEGEELEKKLSGYIKQILDVAYNLQPFLPETAEKIIDQFTAEKIVSGPGLFPRLG